MLSMFGGVEAVLSMFGGVEAVLSMFGGVERGVEHVRRC